MTEDAIQQHNTNITIQQGANTTQNLNPIFTSPMFVRAMSFFTYFCFFKRKIKFKKLKGKNCFKIKSHNQKQ